MVSASLCLAALHADGELVPCLQVWLRIKIESTPYGYTTFITYDKKGRGYEQSVVAGMNAL